MTQNKIGDSHDKEEHILVCLSASPSNVAIIHTAAKMAEAFQGAFTAIYVQTQADLKMGSAEKKQLQSNMELAKQLGADISTVYGEDISYQISEFARISKVTKIVIGRTNINKHHFWRKLVLTERLIEAAENIEIHIIPDSATDKIYKQRKQ